MRHSIFVLVIFFVLVDGYGQNTINFSPNKVVIKKCLKNNNFFVNIGFEDTSIKTVIDHYFALRFFVQNGATEEFYSEIHQIIQYLVDVNFIEFYNDTLRFRFEKEIRKALLYCFRKIGDQKKWTANSADYQELPRFPEEKRFEPLLNIILAVDSLGDKKTLLNTTEKRFLFRKYTEQALYIYTFTKENDNFESDLRRHWQSRALSSFDGRKISQQFIEYIYDVKHDRPYTRGNTDIFFKRQKEDFNNRNPPALQKDITIVLNILKMYLHQSNYNIVHRYEVEGMSSSEYYLEIRLVQFFSLLFLSLEMKMKGIDNKNDVWSGPIPYDVLPESIQAIAYDLDAYHDYIFKKTQSNNDPVAMKVLFKTLEDFRRRFLRRPIVSTTTITTALTTISTISTTPVYDNSTKSQELMFERDPEEYLFPKQQSNNNMQVENNDKKLGPTKKLNYLQQQKESVNKYHGYITCNGFQEQLNVGQTLRFLFEALKLRISESTILEIYNR